MATLTPGLVGNATGGKAPPSPNPTLGTSDDDVDLNHSTPLCGDIVARHSDRTLGPGASGPTLHPPSANPFGGPSPTKGITAVGPVASRDVGWGGHSLPEDSDFSRIPNTGFFIPYSSYSNLSPSLPINSSTTETPQALVAGGLGAESFSREGEQVAMPHSVTPEKAKRVTFNPTLTIHSPGSNPLRRG